VRFFVALGQNNSTTNKPLKKSSMNANKNIHVGEITLYQPDSSIRLEVRVEDETVWLNQAQMATLFGRNQSVISRHIANIFKDGELEEKSNMHFLHITNADRPTAIYNLDVIISVGYRVKSKQGIQFRQWASRVLKEYLLRGYAINQRIEQVEKFMIETGQRIIKTEVKFDLLTQYIEDVLSDYNDINEDTRMQLELIHGALAKLQAKNRELDRPRRLIGFRRGAE